MAKRRGTTEGTADDRHWPHLLSVGLLVGSIGCALILGAALKNDAPSAEEMSVGRAVPQSVRDPQLSPPSPPAPPAPRAVEGSQATGGLVDVATLRAERDLDRVSGSPGSWTAQLALLCDAARVAHIVDEFGADSELYVLPAYHDGKACFVVCWGLYDRIEGARSAGDLPAALRSALSDPYPKQLSDVFEGLR